MNRGQNVVLVETWVDGVRRQIAVSPAYGPDERYGNGSMRFEISVARGGAGVSWEFHSDWFTHETRADWERQGYRTGPADGLGELVRHSHVAFREDMNCNDTCTVLGRACYSTGSGLASEDLFDKFVLAPEGLWATLEGLLFALEAEIEQELANTRNFS